MSGAANDAATWVPAELPADQDEAAFEPEWWLEESTLISPFTTDVSTGSAGTAQAALVEAPSSPFRSPAEIEALAVDDDETGLDEEDEGFEDGPRGDEAYWMEGSEEFDQGEDGGLGAALEGEHPLSRLFRLPAAAFEALAKGAFPAVIALAGAAGYRDVNDLTNIIFYFRNPHVIGRRIRPDERDLQQAWLNIRDTIVRPALKALAVPASVPAPTGAKTSIPASGLQWHGPGTATPELLAFMCDVYNRHVARSSGTFVDTLPESALETIEGPHQAQRQAARKAIELLAAARADLRDPGVKIGITSAYRSADRQFDIWQGKGRSGQRGFPYYYRKSKTARQRLGDEHGPKAAAYLTALIAKCIAAPGYSNHQDGLAIDFGTGVVGKKGLAKIGTKSWFYKWLTKNAHRFNFEPYPAEAWHWVYKPPAGSPQAFESEAWLAAASPTGIRAGRLDVDRSPTLASHRGKSPDIVLRWNDMPSGPSEIDVVVHLHGYSGPSMTLPKSIEPWSGLDLAPVDGAAGSGRRRPTLTILPRGHFTGEQRGKLYKYTFPALITKDGLPKLINSSLARFAHHHGSSKPAVRRLIITAHSGGGAALMRILRNHDPHEIHVFDGLYQDATALAEWASRHIRQDRSASSPPGGALRVFYRPGTRRFSQQLLEAISADLASAPSAVQDRYRVEASTLGHWQIPRQYGWRILADATANVPAARRDTDTTVQRLDELESTGLLGDDDEAAIGEPTAETWQLEQPEIEEPEQEDFQEPHHEGLEAPESEWELLGPTDEAQAELSAAAGTPEDSHEALFDDWEDERDLIDQAEVPFSLAEATEETEASDPQVTSAEEGEADLVGELFTQGFAAGPEDTESEQHEDASDREASTMDDAGGEAESEEFTGPEHKAIGDRGSGAERSMIAYGSPVQLLTFGDVVALAGDYFDTYYEMRDLARSPGGRAQIAWARWHCLDLSKQHVPEPPADKEQKKAVTDRYFLLASRNLSHFSAGGTAWEAYSLWHARALVDALDAGRTSDKALWQRALTKEAFGDHFLTDMFSAGHVRMPRAAIRDWYARQLPTTDHFLRYMAKFIFDRLDERQQLPPLLWWLGWIGKVVGHPPESVMAKNIQRLGGEAIRTFSLGDIVGLALHDHDNKGLPVVSDVDTDGRTVPGGHRWTAVGDVHLSTSAHSSATWAMATAALIASLRDLERVRGTGVKLGNRSISTAQRAAAIKQALGGPVFAARRFVPREDRTSSAYVPLIPANGGRAPLDWRWGQLGDLAYRAVDETVKGKIAGLLSELVGEVDDPLSAPLGQKIYGTRNAFLSFVRHLRTEGITAIEKAVGKPAR